MPRLVTGWKAVVIGSNLLHEVMPRRDRVDGRPDLFERIDVDDPAVHALADSKL
jgi:hypothetical protein